MPAKASEGDAIAEQFRGFAEHRAGHYAPLYSRLAAAIATAPDLLQLAGLARPGQSRPDLLLAAIHYLLLGQPHQPAARFYRSLNAIPDAADPDPDVLDFARAHHDELAQLVATRLVQTNEVRRATFLTPALHAAASPHPGEPLALIEVGASAGLGLLFDRYHYRYTTAPKNPPDPAGDVAPDGPVIELSAAPGAPVLDCQLRGPGRPPLALPHPPVTWRAGIDLNPLDPRRPEDRRWLTALTWPDHPHRAARLSAALDLAALDPPTVHRGDAAEHLPGLVAAAPSAAHLIVYHCAVMAHTPPPDRERFTAAVLHASRDRAVSWIQAEPRTDGDPRRLRLTHCARGRIVADVALGKYQPHGEWLYWSTPPRHP